MTEYFAPVTVGAATRLLVVDDEPNIRTPLARALSLQGYAVEEAGSGREALKLLEGTPYNLMVLDMRLPGVDGVEILQQARQMQPKMLIIILTGHATLENAIAAVKAEAVDFLLKPASTRQILSAVAQALRKHPPQMDQEQLLHIMRDTLNFLRRQVDPPANASVSSNLNPNRFVHVSPLTLDRRSRRAIINNDPSRVVDLTAGETAILASLMARPGQVLSCRELAQKAWDRQMKEEAAQRLVRPHISRLRRKFVADPRTSELIQTVRRHGYYFAPDQEQ